MAKEMRQFANRDDFRCWNEEMSRRFDPDLFYDCSGKLIKKIEEKRIRIALKFLDAKTDDVILDIGCGSGRIAEVIKSKKIIGVDISDYLLQKAKQKIRYPLKAEGESLPFKDESFDKVICSEVLEHVIAPEVILAEASRILKKNGILVVTVPNEIYINFIKKIFIWRMPLKKRGTETYHIPNKMDEEWHLHSFSLDKFRRSASNRFNIDDIKAIPFGIFPLRYALKCSKLRPAKNYENDLFDKLFQFRNKNFFYKGRAMIVKALIRDGLKNIMLRYPKTRIADIGCGHGSKLFPFLLRGADIIVGIDVNFNTLSKIKKMNMERALFVNANILNLPFKQCFDAVLLFDVLEHVDDDSAALNIIYQICKDGAILAITVPAIKCLFGEFDRLAFHKRRYAIKELEEKLVSAGFKIKKVSYFIFFLFPFIFFYRVIRELLLKRHILARPLEMKDAIEIKTIPILNELFLYTMILESVILKKFRLILGTSIIAIAEK